MSGRALRRLRKERESESRNQDVEEDSDSEDDDGEVIKSPAIFAMMADSDSDDDDDDDEEEEEEEEKEKYKEKEKEEDESDEGEGEDEDKDFFNVEKRATANKETKISKDSEDVTTKDEENLDALLSEFEIEDSKAFQVSGKTPSSGWFWPEVIVTNMDIRDLDIDYVMRTNLLGSTEPPPSSYSQGKGRSSRNNFLFGSPRDGWKRPPHFVGGGIGMTTHDNDTGATQTPPWPYVSHGNNAAWKEQRCWYRFMYSDTYKKDLEDYKRVQDSGDANALALFVAHHPFVIEALLQLTMLLYMTNQSQEGLLLLRRCLWIFECSALVSFAPYKQPAFVDYDQEENKIFMMALFRMMQVSSISGCMRTALAVSRYLLAVDPLRDPMGTLLIMDYFALSTRLTIYDQFVVLLVESSEVELFYKEPESGEQFVGTLLDMPNWSYSYALALYRLSLGSDATNEKERADGALRNAIQKFPSVVEQILVKNEVDLKARSLRADWPAVLPYLRAASSAPPPTDGYDPIVQHASTSVSQIIIQIFVARNHKLWSSDDVALWLFGNVEANNATDDAKSQSLVKVNVNPSILRYAHSDPGDYEERFRTLPPEANPLDPGFLAPAMAVDPNRRRLFRGGGNAGNQARMDQQQREMDEIERAMAAANNNGRFIFGPPSNVVDPDSPMLEVFLRSALPWNRVDGVPPPARR